VTAEKIYAGAVTTTKLAAGAVTADKLTVDTTTTNKILAGIAQIGGLSADHIKAGTISYDRLNVAYARVSSVQGLVHGSATIVQTADNQDDPNIIKLSGILPSSSDIAVVTFSHNKLETLVGNVAFGWRNAMPTHFNYRNPYYNERVMHFMGDLQVYVGMYSYGESSIQLLVRRAVPGAMSDFYFYFKRHSIA